MPGPPTAPAPPAGFEGFAVARSWVVCAPHVANAVRDALAGGTLYQYAERHPQMRRLTGRGAVYAVPLPRDVERVVIRHNRHGGLLAPLTGDLFRAPTLAPRELRISEQLREYGVPTPVVLGYVIYDGPAGFKRADVITREVPDSFDLSTAFMSPDVGLRARAIAAAADAVLTLCTVGARHHDLNVKNILMYPTTTGVLAALILDVDRVVFEDPEVVFELNIRRLLRSARKWQRNHNAPVTDAELEELAGSVRERRPPPVGDKTAW